MKRRVNGWSLIETVVVIALLSAILVALSQTLGPTLRLASRESDRGNAHGRLMLIMEALEKVLQRSSPAGIAWQAGPPALLAIHTQSEDPLVAGTRWDPAWICFLHESRKLWQRTSPPTPALAPPPTDRPAAPEGPQLSELLATPSSHARLLSPDVSVFECAISAGPVADLTVEIEVRVQGRSSPEKLRGKRHLYLRN